MFARSLLLTSLVASLPAFVSCKDASPKSDDRPKTPSKEPAAKPEPSPKVDKTSSNIDGAKKPTSFDGLTVTLDGKATPMKRAFLKRLPDGAFQLYVSNKNGSCGELLVNLFNGSEGGVDVLVQLVTLLGADGSETMKVKDVFMGPPTEADAGSKVKVHGSADPGTDVAVDLEFTSQAGSGAKLAVKGSLTAEGCGAPDTSKGPGIGKLAHPSTAKMTIAGKTFDVKGAIRQGDAVELTDFPRDCTTAWFIGARLRFERGTWVLDGTRFAGSSEGSGKGLKVEAGKKGDGEDGKTVEVKVSGEGKVGEYGVRLEGVVEALECGQ